MNLEHGTRNLELQFSLRLKVQGDPVDTVTKFGRRRSVVEHMTEVPPALAAVHLDARHPVAPVDGLLQRSLQRLEKAPTAGAALEIAVGEEERLTAAGA